MAPPRPAVDAAWPPFPGTPASSPTPRRVQETRKPAALISVGMLFVTAVTFALAWMVFSFPPTLGKKNTTEEDFCCPEEAALLFSVIEKSILPCKDFFAHVCKNAISEGIVKRTVAQDILEDIKRKITTGVELFSSPSAAALYRFYTSCLREVWQEELRYTDVTTAILEIGNAKYPMTSADQLHFALNVHYRYNLVFFFSVSYGAGEGIRFARNSVSIAGDMYCGNLCLHTTLAVVNTHFDTNYTLEEIAEWERHLPGPSKRTTVDNITLQELQDALNGLDTSLLKAILQEFSIYLEEGTPIFARDKQTILQEIRLLWNTSSRPLSLFHMMMAVALAALPRIQFYPVLKSPGYESSLVCGYHGYNLEELWRRTIIKALINKKKTIDVTNIFKATKHAFTTYYPLRKIMGAGNDTEKFEAFIRNMSILLPTDLVLWGFPAPSLSTQGFIRSFFRLLSFQFETKTTMSRRGMLYVSENLLGRQNNVIRFVNETALYVPAIMFSLLSSNTTDAMLADTPVIGTNMASIMWEKIAKESIWSPRTKQAISEFRSCIASTQSKSNASQIPAVTMGLHIALEAMEALPFSSSTGPKAADWHEPKAAWSLNQMSNAEFFYMRYAYSRCKADQSTRILLNAPLKMVPDFLSTFGCRANKNVPTIFGCLNVTMKPTTS